MRRGNYGHEQTPETREKISKRLLGRHHSPEACEKIKNSKVGVRRKPFTEEWRENMSKSALYRSQKPAFLELFIQLLEKTFV